MTYCRGIRKDLILLLELISISYSIYLSITTCYIFMFIYGFFSYFIISFVTLKCWLVLFSFWYSFLYFDAYSKNVVFYPVRSLKSDILSFIYLVLDFFIAIALTVLQAFSKPVFLCSFILWKGSSMSASRRNVGLYWATCHEPKCKYSSGFRIFSTTLSRVVVLRSYTCLIYCILCRMDDMVIGEASRHGLRITEVAGTRAEIRNLGGVIYEITCPWLIRSESMTRMRLIYVHDDFDSFCSLESRFEWIGLICFRIRNFLP